MSFCSFRDGKRIPEFELERSVGDFHRCKLRWGEKKLGCRGRGGWNKEGVEAGTQRAAEETQRITERQGILDSLRTLNIIMDIF
jgi:hypothetical protein